jgi:hypothetical protein
MMHTMAGYKMTLALGLLAAAATSTVEAAVGLDWHQMIRDFGILTVLVFFFTWASWKREERISTRVTTLEQFVSTELMTCVKTSTEALKDNTNALNNLKEMLHEKPCLADDNTQVKRLEAVADRLERNV